LMASIMKLQKKIAEKKGPCSQGSFLFYWPFAAAAASSLAREAGDGQCKSQYLFDI
jgi:hypothetical protein